MSTIPASITTFHDNRTSGIGLPSMEFLYKGSSKLPE